MTRLFIMLSQFDNFILFINFSSDFGYSHWTPTKFSFALGSPTLEPESSFLP